MNNVSQLDWYEPFQRSNFPALLLDRNFVIVACNAAWESAIGRSAHSLVGGSLFEVLPANQAEQQPVFRESCMYVLETGETHQIPYLEYYLDDGRAVWSVTNTPIRDKNGDVEFVLSQPTNITDLTYLREKLNPFSPALVISDADAQSQRSFSPAEVHQILAAERERLEKLFQQAPSFICILRGPDHVYEMANDAYYQLVGHRKIIGHELAEVLPEVVPQGFLTKLNNVYRNGIPYIGRAVPVALQRTVDAPLEQTYVDLMYQPIRDDTGKITGIFVQGHDVTEAHQLSQEVSYQATHDPLTGLANRRLLAQEAEAFDQEQDNHTLLYIDLDHFKIVNDRCGHHAGDELLVQVCQVLKAHTRSEDILARLGGDEFVLVLRRVSETVALELANSLRHAVEEVVFVWEGRRYGVTISVGLVSFGITRLLGFTTALSLADSACFLAKEKGRNRIQASKADDLEIHKQQKDMDWASMIKEAIADDRFVVWGQKISAIGNKAEVPRIELLARLLGENGELIPPGAFIPAAERFGIIEMLDYHIVRKAFHYLSGMDNAARRPTLFVNLSGVTLGSQDFVTSILDIAGEYADVDVRNICFEVTETSAITHLAQTSEAMRCLVDAGFGFALDDFGSGMSSFGYLERMPANHVKIDGAFIKDIDTNPVSLVIVEAITKVATTMGMETIAEHVENPDQLRLLGTLGVDCGQGYAIHRPEPLADILID